MPCQRASRHTPAAWAGSLAVAGAAEPGEAPSSAASPAIRRRYSPIDLTETLLGERAQALRAL
jgi:hypothetical protein